MVASGKAERAQEKNEKNIHPIQGLPLYGEDATDSEGDPLHQGSCVPSVASGKAERWYGSQSLCPTGEPWLFIGWPEFERSELGNSSRVPRYQKGRRISGLCNSSVKSSHIGEDLDGVDASLLLSSRRRK